MKNMLVISMSKVFLAIAENRKTIFSNKCLNSNNMMLAENKEIARKDEIMNSKHHE